MASLDPSENGHKRIKRLCKYLGVNPASVMNVKLWVRAHATIRGLESEV